MKRLEVKESLDYDRTNSWKKSNPYTIYFIYPKDGQPYVLKGGLRSIEVTLKKEERPALVHYRYYHKGEHRGGAQFINLPDNLFGAIFDKRHSALSKFEKNHPYEIYVRDKDAHKQLLNKRVKRVPRRWLKDLNEFLD